MSGNGGNPHSLRDLLGTYEKSGLAAYQDTVRARINRQSVQQGLHLSQRRLELFKKAAERVLSDNPELGRYELRGSRIVDIDPALATAALTSATNHFQDYLPETPFVAARQVAIGLVDVLLPEVATHVLVFPKSESSVYRTRNEFILVRISEALQRHIANAHRLIEELQLAFTAIPLNSLLGVLSKHSLHAIPNITSDKQRRFVHLSDRCLVENRTTVALTHL